MDLIQSALRKAARGELNGGEPNGGEGEMNALPRVLSVLSISLRLRGRGAAPPRDAVPGEAHQTDRPVSAERRGRAGRPDLGAAARAGALGQPVVGQGRAPGATA